MCKSMRLFSDIVDLKYVNNLFITENVLSEVEDVIGTVKYNFNNLCTSDASSL